MASSKKSSTKSTGGKKPAPKATASTAVRHSAIPKLEAFVAPAPREVTSEMIAHRAYEIWASGTGGSEIENWSRAERELRAA